MKYCEVCQMHIAGRRERCPLCHSIVTGEASPETFPHIPARRHLYRKFFLALLGLSLLTLLVCGLINYLVSPGHWWVLIVAAGLGCMWVGLFIIYKKRKNVPKTVLYQVVVAMAIVILWDYLTGWHHWSIDYVLPIVCAAAMLVMVIVPWFMPRYMGDRVVYVLLDGLLCAIPTILWLTGNVHVFVPSLVCMIVGIVSIILILILERRRAFVELKRRLHI